MVQTAYICFSSQTHSQVWMKAGIAKDCENHAVEKDEYAVGVS